MENTLDEIAGRIKHSYRERRFARKFLGERFFADIGFEIFFFQNIRDIYREPVRATLELITHDRDFAKRLFETR